MENVLIVLVSVLEFYLELYVPSLVITFIIAELVVALFPATILFLGGMLIGELTNRSNTSVLKAMGKLAGYGACALAILVLLLRFFEPVAIIDSLSMGIIGFAMLAVRVSKSTSRRSLAA
jgi:hypothetical protein